MDKKPDSTNAPPEPSVAQVQTDGHAMVDSRPKIWLGCVVAFLLVAAAVFLRITLLDSLGTRAPYVTFYPAVIFAALYGGVLPGLLATALAAAATPVFWHNPENRFFFVHEPSDWLAMAVFIAGGAMITWVCEAMHRAKARAVKAETQAKLADERRRADEALRESEARFRLALLNKPIAVFQQDRDLRYTWIHNPHRDFSVEMIVGKTDADLMPPEYARPLTELKQRVMETGVGAREELNTPINGLPSWWDITVEPWRSGQGEILGISGAAMDITEHKRMDDALRFLVDCGVGRSSEDFFQALARYLADNLRMDYVCIDRLKDDLLAAETVAVCYDGKLENNISYTLKDTPCGDVVGKTVCCFASDVRNLFPKDAVLQEIPAESYVGTTLWGSQGKPIGLIAVIGRKPLADAQLAASILQVVAVRAAGELERRQAEEALRKSEAALHRANEKLLSVNEQLEERVRERTADLERRTAQLRALAKELTQTEQRERQRLAKILHDHMQQLLVGAKFRVASLGKLPGERLNQAASDLDKILNDCIEASRSLTAELSPPILQGAGLVPALEWLGRWAKQKHSLFVQVDAAGEVGSIRDEVRILLFEAVRELLFNVVKHSGVKSAKIKVACRDGEMRVTVADQGCGFDPPPIPSPFPGGGGFGLFSIRERLDLIGGRMEIETARGKGAAFHLIVASG